MDFLRFSLDLLLLCTAFGNAMPTSYDSDWIPVMLTEKTTQTSSSSDSSKTKNDWKVSEPLFGFGGTTDKLIKTVTPQQFERKNGTISYNLFEKELLTEVKETTKSSIYDNKIKDPKDYKTLKSFPYIQMNEKTNTSSPDFEFPTESLLRTSKEIKNYNFINDIRNLYQDVIKMKTTDARAFMSPDREGNDYYAVTEPTDEAERNEKNGLGYVYKQPVVVPMGLTTARNEFSERLQDNLKKYNINSNEMLNNYAISKNYVNNYDSMFQIYRTHIAPVIAIPFRYNGLNHLPVNPLLGVFLSNFGYYVRDGNGLLNYYRNLYGFAANQIVNDRVTGNVPSQRSYKMLYDTDSGN